MTRGNKYIFKSDNTATYIILKFLLLLSLDIGIYMFRVLGVRYRNINQLSHESKITRVNKYIFKSVYTATYIILKILLLLSLDIGVRYRNIHV